jgi:hypothetical protein
MMLGAVATPQVRSRRLKSGLVPSDTVEDPKAGLVPSAKA